ncbi:DUF1488 family protein [Propionivibrio sp.]|jgi:transcriptional regulator with XRE-family HTH domain|uniref:DUF1488 family protein n=1 Tax=Propionivibrio sp. TaxID=2212460 RepID=UPI0025E1C30C|nr:DUF1488 family protein [Propionivibrio sp.]MBK8744105.1 DUF1488 family protein [Propionivibrio sp.]
MGKAIIASQIKAGRTLVDCSQEELAKAAGIGLTSLREIEAQKRPSDTAAVAKIRDALENKGVYFMQSGPDHGPGVCLRDNRPNIIRPPSTLMMWEGMPFSVEWKGKEVIVFVSREVIEDLGHLSGNETDEVYLETFDKHRGDILDGVAKAIVRDDNFDKKGRLYVRAQDIASLA